MRRALALARRDGVAEVSVTDFVFAEPRWLHALWIVLAAAVVFVLLERRAGRKFEGLVSLVMQTHLVAGPSARQRQLRIGFLALTAACGVIGLARPQWGFEYVKTPRSSAELMIALDVSRSMLAEDVVPNRLERAKAEIRDLLEYLSGDHVGLIAFAGRASVLAPMTPDFGFFRLVLDGLGPHSVSRGGTRLEEPIRKAIQGFRATGDVSRVLLLITDGEDHDSFPIEAAKEAAERGIRIIAIGFGSESGSEIPITDPRTGARILVRDSDGQIVYSRLDGDMLREMALITDGVYVPAGTGALDLDSIYEQHIAGLMRAEIDDQGQVVRKEGFQWAVLAAMAMLLASVFAGQGGVTRSRVGGVLTIALAIGIGIGMTPVEARAQAGEPARETSVLAEAEGETPTEAAAPEPAEPVETDPRVAFNDALDRLNANDFDAAERLFEVARSHAGTDGEARYRATYGLAWTVASRADSLLEQEPDQALQHLYRAGDYFREAIRLQAGNEDPRHNLEVVLQRARVLADSLARREEKDIAAFLDELIERERESSRGVKGLLAGIAAADQGAQLDDSFRSDFRTLSTQQRQILSDSDAFAERVVAERSELGGKPEEERTPEDQMRGQQLEQVEEHLQRARERMGHARRELRGRRAERAYRRMSGALDALKRARDQLRDPVEILDALLRDASELTRYTQAMAAIRGDLPGIAKAPAAPAWLTPEFLEQAQGGINDRAGELYERLAAGLVQHEAQPPPEPTSPEEEQQLIERERLMRRVAEATPLVERGIESFQDALISLDAGANGDAATEQVAGVQALAEARERFVDLRGLIELSYSDQERLQGVLDPDTGDAVDTSAVARELEERDLTEYLPALGELQERNLARSERIAGLIDEARESLPLPDVSEDEGEPDTSELQRLDLADQILLLTQSAMAGVVEGLQLAPTPDAPTPWRSAIVPGKQAVKGLDNLRRLFFSLIEHLRQTARDQQELNDETEKVSALPGDDPANRIGPLVPRQAGLAKIAGEIAMTLEEQSREQPLESAQGNAPGGEEAAAEESERLRRAAELTLQAQIDMEAVGVAFDADTPDLAGARERQDSALEYLAKALEALKPPEQEGDQDQQQEQQQEQEQDEQQEQDQQEQEQQAAEEERQDEASASNELLQEVRDREAQRQRERARRQQRNRETVEKDW